MALQTELIGAGVPVLQTQLLGQTQEEGKTATGTTRTDAYALTATTTQFTTAGSGTGAVLPSAVTVAQTDWYVKNDGANDIKVYAAGSDTISGTAGSSGVTVVAGEGALFKRLAAGGGWIVFPMGT